MITAIRAWLDSHPKLKQWLWFIVLWTFGFLAVTIFTYPIKWLMKSM